MRYHHRLIVELFKKKTLKHSHSEFGLVPEMVWQKPRLQKEQQNSSKPIRGATHSICILSIISIGSRIAVAWFLSSICFSCRSSRTTELTMSVEVVFGLFLFRRRRKKGIIGKPAAFRRGRTSTSSSFCMRQQQGQLRTMATTLAELQRRTSVEQQKQS